MSPVPARPQLYHITHVENLARIIADGGLQSDAALMKQGGPGAAIGMSSIKQRRLSLPVKYYFGLCVGDCVPFYFCPRSVMLYLIYCGNHPELSYRGGQGPIVHLEADLYEAMDWADADDRHWAFSLSNAGAVYTEFRNQRDQLDEIDWTAVAATDFRDPQAKEGKQAEFLMHEFFPWMLIRRIGVQSRDVEQQALRAFAQSRIRHRPAVEIQYQWYY